MIHFSSKKAIEFSFSTYCKHFVLLTVASAIMGAPLWFSSFGLERIAQKSGIRHALDIAAIGKQQGYSATMGSVGSQLITNLKTVSVYDYCSLLLIFFLGYALFFYLTFGLMNLCLSLKDTGQGSLKLLFSSRFQQVKHFVGAAVLYWLGIVVGSIAAVLATLPVVMICKLFLSIKIITVISVTVVLTLFFAMLVWLMGYMFFGFCILDNPSLGTLEALRMSAVLVKGSRGRIIKTVLFMLLGAMGPLFMLLIVGITGTKLFSLGNEGAALVLNVIPVLITYPIFFLCGSYIYRLLNPKQSA